MTRKMLRFEQLTAAQQDELIHAMVEMHDRSPEELATAVLRNMSLAALTKLRTGLAEMNKTES